MSEPMPGGAGEAEPSEVHEPELFAPGPLATVEIVPRSVRVPPGGERRLRARPRDAEGREILAEIAFHWSCSAADCRLEGDGREVVFHAGSEPQMVKVAVEASQGERCAKGEATVEVVTEELEGASAAAGIPQPELVNEATGNWRSRLREGKWEVNAGHRDYLIACESARRKLRYLAALLAKEIVLHSFPHPQHASVLERMVEVLTITERRLER